MIKGTPLGIKVSGRNEKLININSSYTKIIFMRKIIVFGKSFTYRQFYSYKLQFDTKHSSNFMV